MTREEALKQIRNWTFPKETREVLETLIPELREGQENDVIDIPFGAKDSELKGWEYTIPEGMEAIIKDGKVIVREKESEGDRIRKYLIEELKAAKSVGELKFVIPQPTREECISYLEKMKEANKAIEVVGRIDKHIKYIRAYTANAYDMDDSNPDKKYYIGVDDTLSNIAGILNGVYSEKENKFAPRALPCSAAWFEDGEEKQKEQKPAEVKDPFSNANFVRGYESGYADAKREQKPAEWSEEEMKVLDSIIDDYKKASKSFCGYDGKIGLLKAIRNGEYNLPKSAEWSEEDREMLTRCVAAIPVQGDEIMPTSYLNKLRNWLESIPERFILQSKQKWSEEDEERIQSILFSIGYCKDEYPNKKDYSKDIDWLKSLRPQPKKNNMITPNKEFFQWIYDRLVNVHNEDPNMDYMISFKRCIEELPVDAPFWNPVRSR